MDMLLETVVLIFVILSVPALVYALQKLTGRRFDNKLFILLLYVLIFSVYLEISERLAKKQFGEDVWLPKFLTGVLNR